MKTRVAATIIAALSVSAVSMAQQTPVPDGEKDNPQKPPSASSEDATRSGAANPGASDASSATGDAALMAELTAAADKDDSSLNASRGSAAIAFEQRQQDPANYLGKEVIGNETNPSISIILDAAFSAFSKDNRLRFGGHAPTTNGPFIQNAELAASAPIDPFFRIDLAHSLSHGHIEEVFLTTTALPWNLQVRAGQFKSQIGRHNPTHLHTWDFVVHPLPNQFLFGGGGLTLPGGEVSVLLPLPWYVEVVGALQIGEAGVFRTKSTDYGAPVMADFVYPARIVQFLDVGDDWGLQIGLNAVHGTSTFAPEKEN
ncbi:MAG TPA: hypothetical protein PLM08_18645, partial [Polyangiaceae bacterium]|nr:hypothetical protein [Polyangiaceae bacterium]